MSLFSLAGSSATGLSLALAVIKWAAYHGLIETKRSIVECPPCAPPIVDSVEEPTNSCEGWEWPSAFTCCLLVVSWSIAFGSGALCCRRSHGVEWRRKSRRSRRTRSEKAVPAW